MAGMVWECSERMKEVETVQGMNAMSSWSFQWRSPRNRQENNRYEKANIHSFIICAATAAKSLQLCPTLCDPIDSSPPGSPVPGILQARTLEWIAISFSNAWKWKVKVKSLSRVQLLRPHGLQPTRLFCPWDLPGKSTGVGCHCLLHVTAADSQFSLQKKAMKNNIMSHLSWNFDPCGERQKDNKIWKNNRCKAEN